VGVVLPAGFLSAMHDWRRGSVLLVDNIQTGKEDGEEEDEMNVSHGGLRDLMQSGCHDETTAWKEYHPFACCRIVEIAQLPSPFPPPYDKSIFC
jgi:hypothetical protein